MRILTSFLLGVAAAVVAVGVALVLEVALRAVRIRIIGLREGAYHLWGVLYVLAWAIVEESLFRKVLLGIVLLRLVPLDLAVATAAAVSGLAHYRTRQGSSKMLSLIFSSSFALAVGYAFAKTGSLSLVIGYHAGWNWLVMLMLGYPRSQPFRFPGSRIEIPKGPFEAVIQEVSWFGNRKDGLILALAIKTVLLSGVALFIRLYSGV